VSALDHFPEHYGASSDALDGWLSIHRTDIEGSEDTRPAVLDLAQRLLRVNTRERLAGMLTVALHRFAEGPSAEHTRLLRRIAELNDEAEVLDSGAERYRLAWTSAAGRALRQRRMVRELRGQLGEVYATSAREGERLDDARQQIIRLTKENEEHHRTIRSWQAAREADEVEFDAWVKRANDGIAAAIVEQLDADEQVEERIKRIKQTAAERVEARQLRAALDEERIEPVPDSTGHMPWCSDQHGGRCGPPS
jgi:hypothetical protein